MGLPDIDGFGVGSRETSAHRIYNKQHLDVFMVKLSIFFSWKVLQEFGLLAFSPAKLFLIGVDWSTCELLVKQQLCEETNYFCILVNISMWDSLRKILY
jgi:hypothetical protein